MSHSFKATKFHNDRPKCKGFFTKPKGLERFRGASAVAMRGLHPSAPSGILGIRYRVSRGRPRPAAEISAMNDEKNQRDQTRSIAVLNTGTIVSHYRILDRIGAGGMGEVFVAEDTKLSRKVALKFLSPHLCQDKDCRKRFEREARAAAGLGSLGDPSAIPVLVNALNDQDPLVRRSAISSLGSIGDSSALSALVPLLEVRELRPGRLKRLLESLF